MFDDGDLGYVCETDGREKKSMGYVGDEADGEKRTRKER